MSIKSIMGIVLPLLLASCDSPKLEDANLNNGTNSSQPTRLTHEEFVKRGNNFSLELLEKVCRANKDQSFVTSPISVMFSMAMLQNGSVGETRSQILHTLGYSDSDSQSLNEYCAETMKQDDISGSVSTNIANGLFLAEPLVLNKDYKDVLTQYYKADYETLDFSNIESLQHINAWCSEKTQGMISDAIKELGGKLLLINTVFFKGLWTNKFDPEKTTLGEFYDGHSHRQQATLPYMFTQTRVKYLRSELYETICLPFGKGLFNMYFILPKIGETCGNIINALSDDEWNGLDDKMKEQDVSVIIPRFRTSKHIELSGILQAMGITKAFGVNAELSSMFDGQYSEPVCLNKVYQDAVLELEEEGAKAAAATITTISGDVIDGNEDQPVIFLANRPFVYLITKGAERTIYYAGVFAGN